MHGIRRLFLLPIALLAAVLVGACEPTAAALPRLTDPDEVLAEALRTTAELEYVHARLDLAVTTSGAGGALGFVVDADVDLGRRELHAVLDGGLAILGVQRLQLLLVGSDMFTRSETAGARWQRMPIAPATDPRAAIPPTPAIAVAMQAVLADDSVGADLRGIEPCGDRSCYRVVVTIPPEVTWRVVNGALFGAPPDQELGPVDPTIPEVTLDVLVEESTRRLVSLATVVSAQGTTVDVTVTLSNHDLELRIVPPPANQVEEMDGTVGGFSDGVIVDDLGTEVAEPGD